MNVFNFIFFFGPQTDVVLYATKQSLPKVSKALLLLPSLIRISSLIFVIKAIDDVMHFNGDTVS